MGVQSFYEVILYVEDMAAMVAFYTNVMGFRVKNLPEGTDYANQYWVELAAGDGGAQLVLHGGGGKQIGKDAPTMGFRVEDVAATREMLIQRGAKLGEIRYPVPGSVVSDGRDPEGNKFSIFSRESIKG